MRTGHRLDRDTASRLASGAVHPDDAPPGFERVAALLAEAASVPDGVEPHRARATVDAMVAAIRAQGPVPTATATGARRGVGRVVTTKLAVVAATLTLGTGAAAAATGSLPASLQDAVAGAISHVGLDLPDSAEDHANVGGKPAQTHGRHEGEDGDARPEHPDTAGQGDVISGITHDPGLKGVPKGPEVAPIASDGKSHAGQHGKNRADTTADDTGARDTSTDGASGNTPDAPGDSDDAGRAANTDGRATADEASGGASTAGPQNARRP